MRTLETEQYVDFTEQSPSIISFCPGIRGLERGLERIFHSVRVAAYVEIEAFIVENLLAAMEEGVVAPAPIWSNLKTFNPYPFRGRIAGVIGGYPCQPFSHAGGRRGTDDPRHLWPFIRQHIKVIQPGWCFFENVAGHLSLGFDVVKRELEEMGYYVEAGIYSAEEIGAPQKRERLFILAVKMGYSDSSEQSEERGNDGKVPQFSEEQRADLRSALLGGAGYQLDHTSSERRPIHEVCTGRHSAEYASETMADTGSFGGGLPESTGRRNRVEAIRSSETMGNSESDDEWNDRECEQPGSEQDRGSGTEMADADVHKLQDCERTRRGRSESPSSSSELADTDAGRCQQHISEPRPVHESGARYTELDHSVEQRLEGYPGNGSGESGWPVAERSTTQTSLFDFKSTGVESEGELQLRTQFRGEGDGISSDELSSMQDDTIRNSDVFRFPAGQGNYQYEWEEPRTIESCLEYTIDGYNFTEDLHRAIGNSVVEQTAELAFRDLADKIHDWFGFVNG